LRRMESRTMKLFEESQKNSTALELKLADTEHNLNLHKRKLVAVKTKLAEAERNNLQMSVNAMKLLKDTDELKAQIVRLQSEKKEQSEQLKRLQREANQLVQLRDDIEMWREMCQRRISFTDFAIRDLALFFKNENGFYQAFNQNAPHRYLSEESKKTASDAHGLGPFVLGHIVVMDKITATEKINPYKLPMGTEFHTVTVEVVALNDHEDKDGKEPGAGAGATAARTAPPSGTGSRGSISGLGAGAAAAGGALASPREREREREPVERKRDSFFAAPP